MRHAFAFVFVICTCAAASVIAQESPTTVNVELKVPLEARTLKGAPYSAEIVNDFTQVLADGNRIVRHSTGRVYRDGDGRVRREEDRASGSPGISIVDPVAGVSYSLDPDSRVAWKTPGVAGATIIDKLYAAKVEAGVKSRRAEDGDAGAEKVTVGAGAIAEMKLKEAAAAKLRAETVTFETNGGIVGFKRSSGVEQHSESQEALAPRIVEGVRLEGHRTTTTIPAGAIGNEWAITISSEEWRSPELQVLVLTDRKDPRNGDSTYRLTHIVRDEPAASLFQVPSDYTIKETKIRRLEMPRPEQ
jgi:hypothetical protein